MQLLKFPFSQAAKELVTYVIYSLMNDCISNGIETVKACKARHTSNYRWHLDCLLAW